jgi:molecular chaperone GrpE
MGKKIEIQDEAEVEETEATEISEDVGGDNQSVQDGANDSPPEDETATELSTAKQEAQKHYDHLLRVSAEFENYKKRTSREMKELSKYANERLIKELLTVVDNLERAVEAASSTHSGEDPFVQGVNLTLNETLKILERHHVTPINSLGETFDPNYHQAMMQEDVGDQPPNTVVRELQKGYMIHERLLRPALVAVSKAGENEHGDAKKND